MCLWRVCSKTECCADVAVSSIDTQNACGAGGSGSLATESETARVEAGTNLHLGLS